MRFALLSGLGRMQAFETPGELARAILNRPNRYTHHVLSPGACWGRDPRGEEALLVWGSRDRTGFVGYALGFGHDRGALEAVLDSAKAELLS